jgi:hypothetical protein
MQLIFRFFVVLFAYWVAAVAAGAVLVIGAVSPPGAADPALQSSEWPVIWFLIFSTSAVVGSVAFVPAVVAILITETFMLRSVLFYTIAGGAIGLFSAYSMGFIESVPQFEWGVPFGTNFELMAAAGIAAGFVYWLIAGRNAGAWRTQPLLSPPA